MPNDASGRYRPADEPAYQGFHSYATSDLHDTNGGVERWPDNWGQAQQEQYEEEDDDDYRIRTRRDYWSALLWTLLWFAVPVLVLIGRASLLSGSPDPVCRASGMGSCASPRAEAFADLFTNAPLWCFALLGALMLTVVLRWASDTWRAATIGFCAAVVAGGAVTVLAGIW